MTMGGIRRKKSTQTATGQERVLNREIRSQPRKKPSTALRGRMMATKRRVVPIPVSKLPPYLRQNSGSRRLKLRRIWRRTRKIDAPITASMTRIKEARLTIGWPRTSATDASAVAIQAHLWYRTKGSKGLRHPAAGRKEFL